MENTSNTHSDPSSSLSFTVQTIYDELAQIGELDTFLREYLQARYETDLNFQSKMFDTMFRHSPKVVPALEVFLLEKLCESFSYFLEYTRECRKPNPKQ